MGHVLAIAIGGAVGAVSRYGVNKACLRWLGPHFAFGTLAVNVLGCFLLGLLFSIRDFDSPRWNDVTHTGVTVGFLGALTTFSTFGLETTRYFREAQHDLALLNIAGNLVLGLAAVYCGLLLGRWFGG
jgi:CrcB protein